MCDAAAVTTTTAPIAQDFVLRIRLGAQVRLRDLPPVLGEVRRAVDAGAIRVELDASGLQRCTEGARELLEGMTRVLETRDVDVVWLRGWG